MRAKKRTRKASNRAEVKAPTAIEAVAQETERTYMQADGRVVNRAAGLLTHEVQACEEHVAGLKASIVEVQAKKAKAEAKLLGLQRVLRRREG